MQHFIKDRANRVRHSGGFYRRLLIWTGLALVALLGAGQMFNAPATLAAASTDPGVCSAGRLLARPDVAGVSAGGLQRTIHVLDNDGVVAHQAPVNPNSPLAGPEQGASSDISPAAFAPTTGPATDGGELKVIGVAFPLHGNLKPSPDGKAITYMPNGQHVGTDQFTYMVEDSCGRTATGKVVVVVFADDVSTTPGLITGPNSPDEDVVKILPPPTNASLKIPAELFADAPGDGDGDGEDNETTYFALMEPEDRGQIPGPGMRFAQVAFRLKQFLNSHAVENSHFAVPLILDVVYDPALLEGEGDETGLEPQLFYWDEESQSWQRDGIVRLSYNPVTGVATFAIYHLTEFALFAGPGEQPSLFMPTLSGQ